MPIEAPLRLISAQMAKKMPSPGGDGSSPLYAVQSFFVLAEHQRVATLHKATCGT